MKLKKFFLNRMIKSYIHTKLRTHFVADNNDYELVSIPTWMGTSKFFLKTKKEDMVVRCYPFTKRRASKRFISASRLIELNGFPLIPKVIYFDFTFKTLFRYGLSVIVVKKVEGDGYEKFRGDREVLLNIAQGLASLNEIQSQRRGEIWNSHKKNFYLYLMKKMRTSLAKIDRYLMRSGDRKKVIFEWFRKWCKKLGNSKEFNLSHPNFTPDDIIIDNTKKVYFLDLDDVLFGTFGFDMTWALFNFFDNEEERGLFKNTYFKLLPEHYKKHWDSFENFYYAWYCLDEAAGYARKAARKKKKDYSSYLKFHQKAINLWQELSHYISQ